MIGFLRATTRACCCNLTFLFPAFSRRIHHIRNNLISTRGLASSPVNNMPNKNYKKKKNKQGDPFIVGPDCIQVLQGSLLNQRVSLVLCGESHQDAIDVTRRGGRFDPKEGWTDRTRQDILERIVLPPSNHNNVLVRVLSSNKKPLPLQKAQEWAKDVIDVSDDDIMFVATLILLWVPQSDGRVAKGKAHLIALTRKDDQDEEEDDISDGEQDFWIDPKDTAASSILPDSVKEWISVSSSGSSDAKSLVWGDLDQQAYDLNLQRLSSETEMPTNVLDAIVQQRKANLQRDGIRTWDDWFAQQRTKTQDEVDLHLILEASVPPWELSLHRPLANDSTATLPPTAECIRRVEEDEEGDIEDDFDPSSDGIGSYLDYIYRRFMEEQLGGKEGKTTDALDEMNPWLHCVDMRDLGCQAACHSDSVKSKWKDLLTPEEQGVLLSKSKDGQSAFLPLEPDAASKMIKFVPETRMNPERLILNALRAEGKIFEDESESGGNSKERHDDGDEFTYPSFEGFFGQNTDFLYYSKHVKLSYSPFLAKCVKSLDTWDQFFTKLFLGGTIDEALSLLSLNDRKEYLYVRSPIRQLEHNQFWHRDDGEHYITYPFFPFLFYLFAKGSSPARTWSSSLFASLCTQDEDSKSFALAARDWTLKKIHHSTVDPKGADDKDCGGEWFEAYLHAAHRDIYDDIDRSDTTLLLKKQKMKSLTTNRKHDIGRIQIPSCKEGFEEILQAFASDAVVVAPRPEVLAKILIDIYMSCLIDFCTVLKICEIVRSSSKEKVVIVLYMGTAHTRAATDFFVQNMRFQKKAFVGKVDWDKDECHSLTLPKSLWNLNDMV